MARPVNPRRVLFIAASRTMWREVATEMSASGLEPTVWLGDWRNYAFGKKNFPDCTVLGLKEVQATISPFTVTLVPDAEFVTRREFIQLKAQAMKLMDRQDETRSFGRLERDAHFYSIVTRLYSLIVERQIEVVIAAEAPHHVAQLIAFRLCEMLGIPTYHLVNNTYVPLVHVARSIVGDPIPAVGAPDVTDLANRVSAEFAKYENGIPTPLYMANQARHDRSWSFLRWASKYWKNVAIQRVRAALGRPEKFRDDVQIRSRFPFASNERRLSMPFVVERIRRNLEREYPRHAITLSPADADLPQFVYFPMPFEPERTSLPDGGDFYEAMDALLALRSYLPDDVAIFVKEHPTQFSRMLPGYKARSQLLYSVISVMPNTTLVRLSVPSSALIEHAQFTCAITGTAALESALIGKQGVVFGTPWFARLPGVTLFADIPPFDELVGRPAETLSNITAAAVDEIGHVAIPGIISVEQFTYFKQKFGTDLPSLVDDAVTVKAVVATIRADLDRR
ncbi:MAG: hypothetical protein RLZ72_371 [Actinomycetota bacterium]